MVPPLPRMQAAAGEQGMRCAPTQAGSAMPQPPPRLYAVSLCHMPLVTGPGRRERRPGMGLTASQETCHAKLKPESVGCDGTRRLK